MDTEKLFVSREIPGPYAFLTGRLANSMRAGAKPMPNVLLLKPTSPLFDRFRALLKQREKEMRVSGDSYVPPPTTEEIVQLYDLVLSELTFHSKPFITDLTIIAGEQREHAKGIADAICSRIIEASAEQKLPSLHLLDSIVKIIGQEYVHYFSLHLPEVFCEAYWQVQPNLHDSMRHLFWTWSVVFPHSVLSKIEAEFQLSQAVNNRSGRNEVKTSDPSGTTHGIHVNQKHMQPLQHMNVDIPPMGTEILKSVRTIGLANSIRRPQIRPHSTVRLGRPDSYRIGLDRSSLLSFDESAVDNSSRIAGGESPSHLALDNPIGGDEELAEWRRKQFNDKSCYKLEISTTYSLGIGNEHQSPRSLVHAYGSDRRTEILGNRSLAVEQLTINAIDKKKTRTSWKNSEEEEFDWEDMSPTFVDRARNSDFWASPHPHHPVSACQSPFSAANAYTLALESRNHWSSGDQLRPGDDSSTVAEELYGLGCRSSSELAEFQTRTNHNLVSHNSDDAWNPPYNQSQPSRFLFHGKIGERGFHLPPLVEKPLRANLNPYGLSAFVPSFSSCSYDSVKLNVNVQTTRPLNINPGVPFKNHGRSQCSSMMSSPKFSNQCNGLFPVNQQNSEYVTASQLLLLSKDEHILNASPVAQLPITSKYTSNNPFLLQRGASSSLLGDFSVASHREPKKNTPVILHQPPIISCFIKSLVATGVLSSENQTSIQDSVGIEFNSDALKIRHESAIRSLYSDLWRQCTTCGLRFKCQREHSSHMDWHVTKNRMSKNQKQKPSRKWFVSQGMWLSSAETLGIDVVPGFLPPEVLEENKENEEMAVPAEEEQNLCALCGEPFDEFYSDEMEEWMYKGAVYLHVPKGSTVGMNRSRLGPIVHSKCRSHSSELSSEEFGLVEGGPVEGGSQRKRLRIN